MAEHRGAAPAHLAVPVTLARGTRWLATATAAILVATAAVALRGPDGARPVPLLMVGITLALAGIALERRGGRGPVPSTLVIVGALLVLLAAEAFLTPRGDELRGFLAVTGAPFVALGLIRDDRRPIAVGLLQWASAVARPGDEVFRHCLVATDVALPLPRIDGLILLGVAALAVAVTMREHDWRVDAGRGFENVGLALLLGALAAKALELPGHRSMCGTGDAIDLGWALMLLVCAAVVGWLGVRWHDQLWAAAGLAAATLFGLAAIILEANPWWGLLVGLPLVALLLRLERSGTPWPRREHAPLPIDGAEG